MFPKLRRKARALINSKSVKEYPTLRQLHRQEEEFAEECRNGDQNEELTECKIGEEVGELPQLGEDDETSDYVFRILTSIKPEKICKKLEELVFLLMLDLSCHMSLVLRDTHKITD